MFSSVVVDKYTLNTNDLIYKYMYELNADNVRY